MVLLAARRSHSRLFADYHGVVISLPRASLFHRFGMARCFLEPAYPWPSAPSVPVNYHNIVVVEKHGTTTQVPDLESHLSFLTL
jgi:hypothetical protein